MNLLCASYVVNEKNKERNEQRMILTAHFTGVGGGGGAFNLDFFPSLFFCTELNKGFNGMLLGVFSNIIVLAVTSI